MNAVFASAPKYRVAPHGILNFVQCFEKITFERNVIKSLTFNFFQKTKRRIRKKY